MTNKLLLIIPLLFLGCRDDTPSVPLVPTPVTHEVSRPYIHGPRGGKAPYGACWYVLPMKCTRGHPCLIRLHGPPLGTEVAASPIICGEVRDALIITAIASCTGPGENVLSEEVQLITDIW